MRKKPIGAAHDTITFLLCVIDVMRISASQSEGEQASFSTVNVHSHRAVQQEPPKQTTRPLVRKSRTWGNVRTVAEIDAKGVLSHGAVQKQLPRKNTKQLMKKASSKGTVRTIAEVDAAGEIASSVRALTARAQSELEWKGIYDESVVQQPTSGYPANLDVSLLAKVFGGGGGQRRRRRDPVTPTPSPSPTPSPTPPPGPTAPGTSTIKFLEWNVYWKNRDSGAVGRYASHENPDIIGLDEWQGDAQSFIRELNSRTNGRSWAVQSGGGWKGYGTEIYYDKNKYQELEGGKHRVGSCRNSGDRAAMWCVLKEKSSNRIFITGGIHLTYCSGGCDSCHERELGELYNKLQAMKGKYPSAPVIWAGDLNRSPNSKIVKNLLQGKIGGRNVFKVDDLAQTRRQTHVSGGEIDYIFGSKGVFKRMSGGRSSVGQDWKKLGQADHLPIYANVRWHTGDGGNPSPTSSPTPSPTPPPNGACTTSEKDPWSTGSFVACCNGCTKEKVNSNGRWHFLCKGACTSSSFSETIAN